MHFVHKFKTVILPASIGNTLEWYDFTLYAYFSLVFARQFFPAHNPFISIMAVYGLFAASYIMRPIGALIFGYIGDKFGRKYSLFYSIILMALSSFLTAILPTYETWGIYSSISLAIIRLIQGFAVGGEYSGASIYLIESAPQNYRTFFGSLALASAYLGFVLSSAVGAILVFILSENELNSWGWRLAFLLGSFLAFLGYYARTRLKETAVFMHIKKDEKQVNPIKNLFYCHTKTFFQAIGIAILPAGFSYMIFVYFGNFLNTYGHYSTEKVFLMNMIMMITAVTLIPFIGLLGDKIGRRKLMFSAAFAIVFLCIPLFKILPQFPMLILIVFTLLNVFYESNIPAEITEMFHPNYRFTGLAVTLNLTNGLAGGFAPMIASVLIQQTNQMISPMYYIIGLSVISIFSLLTVRTNK